MKVQFITGRPGTGKTALCHGEIAAKQMDGQGGSLILIVPEQYSFQSEKALIAATGGVGLFRARVLSFNRLSYFVFSKTGGIGRKILEESGKHMLLRRVVASLKDSLGHFKSGWDRQGFLDKLASLVTEFYRYGVSPNDLLARAATTSNQALRLKLLDLGAIYSAYKNFLEAEYISSEELLDILAEKISEADFLRGAQIWIDGFKSFTPQERKVLRALTAVARSVKITLCLQEQAQKSDNAELDKYDAFFEARETMAQLTRMAQSLNAEVLPPVALDEPRRYPAAPDIAFLCQNFLGFESRTYPVAPKNIRIFAATNLLGEIRGAANVVTMLTRERGWRYGEIGIIAADLESYQKYIPAIFSQYNIPVFVDARRDVLGHPLPELIFAALEVISSNWAYEAVFRMLRSVMTICPRNEVDILENYVLAYNIRGSAWRQDFKLGDPAELEIINPIRKKVLAAMQPLDENLSPRKKFPIKDICTYIYHFLVSNNIPEALARWIDAARLAGDNQALREHEGIWAKVMDTTDKLVEILGSESEGASEFSKILQAGMGDMGLAPPSLDQLVVGDLRRSRFGELNALIILGANEGMLPSRPDPGGLLDDADRTALARMGIELAIDSVGKIYEEEFLIYSNFSKPREYLAISYHNGDSEGKGSVPSRLLERIEGLFPQAKVVDIDDLPENSIANITNPATAFGGLIAAVGAGRPPPVYLDALDYFKSRQDYAARLDAIEEASRFFSRNLELSGPNAKSLYGRGLRTSASRLERYAACPFAYFAEYTLGLRPRRGYEVAAVDVGNIYHDIMAQFGAALQNDPSAADKLADTAISQVLNDPKNNILQSSGKHRHIARKIGDIARVSAAAAAAHLKAGDFAISFNEVAFNDLNAITIPLKNGAQMHLSGRIDRVDIGCVNNNEFVKIIDYKSGRDGFDISEVFHGLDMQLLLYLAAFIQQLGVNFQPAAALYFQLQEPRVVLNQKMVKDPNIIKSEMSKIFRMSGIVLDQPDVVRAMDRDFETESQIIPVALKKSADFTKQSNAISAEAFAGLLNHVMTLAQSTGDEIAAGKIPIAPYKHKGGHGCQYCAFRPICKFDPAENQGFRKLDSMSKDQVVEISSNFPKNK